MKRRIGFVAALSLSLGLGHAAFAEQAQSYWPADAKVFFVEPKNGAEISGPVKVVMGVEGIQIAPAGTEAPHTGHHHILIDVDPPAGGKAQAPLPADGNHIHFGKGQTETTLTLAPGAHTLQLVVGDGKHVPHDPLLASEKITITVK
ncbi:MAG: DUF4399 domain-containing protein [Rhodomicrobium sp.]|jgi:hypothetical protein